MNKNNIIEELRNKYKADEATIRALKAKHSIVRWPKFFKDFLNKLVDTEYFEGKRFYYSGGAGHFKMFFEVDDEFLNKYKYLGVAYTFPTKYNPDTIVEAFNNKEEISGAFRIGLPGFYKHDDIDVLNINLKSRRAYIETGKCLGQYCSKKKINKTAIPEELKPILKELYDNYLDWRK